MSLISDIHNDLENSAIQLIAEYRARLFADAVRLCDNQATADDLVSRTFLKVINNIDQHRPDADFYAWMKTIMVNLHRDDLDRPVTRGTTPIPAEALELYAGADNSTDEQILRNSDHDVLRAALEQLDPEYRRMVSMYYYNELSLKEIASFFQTSTSSVSRKLEIARKIIAAKVGAQLGKKPIAVLLAALLGIGTLFGAWVSPLGDWVSEKVFGNSTPVTVSVCVGETVSEAGEATKKAAEPNVATPTNGNSISETPKQEGETNMNISAQIKKTVAAAAVAAVAAVSAVGETKGDAIKETKVPLLYVECTGEQWVDIDFTPKVTSIVEMDVEFTDKTGEWHNTLFCSRDSNSKNPFSLYALGGNLGWRYDSGVPGSNSGLHYPVDRYLHLRVDARCFLMDDVPLLLAPTSVASDPGGRMMLFASYSGSFGNGISNLAKLRCRSVVLRDSSDPKFYRELRPYSINGRACLLDTTTGTPYYSSGAQPFVSGLENGFLEVIGVPSNVGQPSPGYGAMCFESTVVTCRAERVIQSFWGKTDCSLSNWRLYRWNTNSGWVRQHSSSRTDFCIVDTNGPHRLEWMYNMKSRMSGLPGDYEELAYVRSDGRQYFDTQYIPNKRTRIVARYQRTVQGEWPHYIFGCQSGDCRFKFSHSNADDKGAIFGYDKNVSTAVNPKIDDDMLEHVVDVSNGVFRVDGETVWTAETPWSSSGNTWSIYLFASHEKYTVDPKTEATVGYHSFTAIGGFTIYEDNVVVHDFVPCQRKCDRAIGFYDLCTKQGQFKTAGGDVPLIAGPVLHRRYQANSGLVVFFR